MRAESILGMQDAKDADPDLHRRIAERIFHNHEVTQSRGLHVAKKAFKQHSASVETLEAAVAVARGFEREVEIMNKGFTARLDKILQAENAKKQKALEAERRRQEERALKLKGRPFNFSTNNRARVKNLGLADQYFGKGSKTFGQPMSNLAYERMLFGQQAYEQGLKHGLMQLCDKQLYQSGSQEEGGRVMARRKRFFLYSRDSSNKQAQKHSHSFSTLPAAARPSLKISLSLKDLRGGEQGAPAYRSARTAKEAGPGEYTAGPDDEATLVRSSGQRQSQLFKSSKVQEAHVHKLHHNQAACQRRNSCESCQSGARKHVWPEKKLRIDKIKPILASSRLIKHQTLAATLRKDGGGASSGGWTRNDAQISTCMSTAEADQFVVKKHSLLRVPRKAASTAKKALAKTVSALDSEL